MAPATNARDDSEAEHLEHGTSAARLIGALVAGTYRLTRHIGSGGSSHVFEAEHVRLGKVFAVKLLRPELDPNRRTAQRFRREARAMARLNNEHIVSVVDCGELDDGTPYLVMELLEGEDLRSLLNREGSLPARRAVPLIIEACRGLSEVHGAGLVHRDLKPENLFITRRSTGEDWCKVLDFGVAKMEASLATAQGAIVGTLRYMAPEQLAASSSVEPSTDIYALGAILYECLCGEPAHPGNTAQEVMYSVMNRDAPDATLRAAKIPSALVGAVMQCLSKQKHLRPTGAGELVALLSRQVAVTPTRAAFATASEDGVSSPGEPAVAKRPLSSRFVWIAGIAALTTTALLSWLSPRVKPASERSPKLITAVHHTAAALASAASRPSKVRPTPSATESPPVSTSQETPPLRASQSADALERRRPAPKAVSSQQIPTPSAQPPRMAVGNFDPANPYGE